MRRLLVLFSALLLTLLGVLAAPQAASAAPLPATYTGSAGGDIVDFDLDMLGANVAGARLGISQSTVDTDADPEVTSRAANLAATVVGLGLGVQDRTQTAPPDADGAETDTIASATIPGVLDLGALTTSVEAHYAGDDVCVADGLLADSRVSTTGVTVGGTGATNVAQTGDAQTRGVVELVPEPAGSPLHRAVQSTATGNLSTTSFLDGAVEVQVAGTPTLQAIATGETGGASVTYTPGDVTVIVGDTTTTVDVGATQTFTVPGGEVQITANAPTQTEAADGQSATGAVTVVTAQVRVGTAALPTATATLDLLPLTAAATAPAGGIDCPPTAPTLTTPADESTTTDTTPPFTGTAEPNSDVEIFVDGASIGTTTADDDGNFSLTPTDPLDLGQRSALAQATLNGATSPDSNVNDFTIEAATLDAPTLTTPADGSTTTDTTPPFTGTAEPNSDVEIFVDGASIGTTTADDDGNFSLTPTDPLDLGQRSALAQATLNGATSPDSDTNVFNIALAPPTLTTPADGSTTDDTTPPFTGTTEPNAEVEIFVDGDSIGTTTADEDGNFSFTPTTPLQPGEQTATATATLDGVTSEPSDGNDFIVDAAAPEAPTLTTPEDGSTTTDSTPPFTGTAEPGSTVEVFVDGEAIGTDTADDDGNYSVTPEDPIADGDHEAYAVATDDAGNESDRSNVNEFAVQAPTTPVITSPEDGSTTTDPTPPITGTADPGTTVTIFIDGEDVGTTTTDPDGNFSFTPTEPLDPGVHDVTAIATDADGNDSDEADPVVFLLVDDEGTPGNGGGDGNGGGANGGGANGNGANGNGGGANGDGGPAAPVLDTVTGLANTGGPGLLIGLLAALGLAGGGTALLVARRRRSAAL